MLALGQHLDDLAESFVMSAFRNGTLRTMKSRVARARADLAKQLNAEPELLAKHVG